MIFLKCCLFGLSLLVLPTLSLPTRQQQQLNTNYTVDLQQFSSHYSTHLHFDHLDNSLWTLSKRISLHFQDLVQVTTQKFDLNDVFVVDVELLKGQLQGAVGSFVEDSLPAIWNTRGESIIDKSSLSTHITTVVMQYCPTPIIPNTCIDDHAQRIVSEIDTFLQTHIINMIQVIVREDLPPLFQTTQSHVNGILEHFGHYLEKNTSTKATAGPIVMYHTLENIDDLITYLQSTVKLYHSSIDSTLLLKKLASLSRVD